MKHLEKLIFVNKNQPNDARVGCKALSNLVDLIDSKLDFRERVDHEFEGSFEQDELKEDQFNLFVLYIFKM